MKNMNTDEEERENLSLFKKAYWQLEHQEADGCDDSDDWEEDKMNE